MNSLGHMEANVVHKVWTRKGYNVLTKIFNKLHIALRSKGQYEFMRGFFVALLHTHAMAVAKVI